MSFLLRAPPTRLKDLVTLLILSLNCFMILQHQRNISSIFYPSDSSDALINSRAVQGKQSCELCVLDPENELCEYGLDNVRLSRGYEGSGFRIRRFLEKAMRNERVKIGIIGASVSLGHGVSYSGNQTWHETFAKDFQRQFPRAKFYKGMIGGVGSQFFSYCFDTLLPSDMDLFVVELDINNEAEPETLNDDDALYRALLELPQQPAVLRVSVPALLFSEMVRGAASGLVVSHCHDVPVIALRNILYPYFLKYPESLPAHFTKYEDGNTDLRHMSYLGHNMLGDLVSIYFRDQVCETKRRLVAPSAVASREWPQSDLLGVIPRLRVNDQYSETAQQPLVNATCQFAGSSSHPLTPLSSRSAWQTISWNDKTAFFSIAPLVPITFKFTGVRVGMFIWVTNGQGYNHRPGRIKCWLDGDLTQVKKMDTFTESTVSSSKFWHLFDGLSREEHQLTCQIAESTSSGGHQVRIIGLGSQ